MSAGRSAFPESVTTARLQLDRLRASDEDDLLAIWAAGDVWQRLRPGTSYDEGIARIGIDRHVRHWGEYGFGLWAVRLIGEPAVIGWIGASHPVYVPAVAAEVEIGWTLHPDHRGAGLATEAARAASEAALSTLGVPRVISLIAADNEASQGVARALGMRTAAQVRHPQLGVTLDVWELRAG